MEWTVAQLAARAGVTGRTLRYWDRVGLLPPTRVGGNGYRYYGPGAVARLQRILQMRRTGMGLAAIGEVLAGEVDRCAGLESHIAALRAERERIDGQLRAAGHALEAARAGVEPDGDVLLEGFNDRYEAEVSARWGAEAFRAAYEWWHGMALAEQVAWRDERDGLAADWASAWREGAAVAGGRARALAARHVAWLSSIPGTPVYEGDRGRSRDMVAGIGDSYVAEPRLAAAFGGPGGAEFVREALRRYAAECM
ncbi:MerR family transcriptional regulator [Nocardiopsis coralliicola]